MDFDNWEERMAHAYIELVTLRMMSTVPDLELSIRGFEVFTWLWYDWEIPVGHAHGVIVEHAVGHFDIVSMEFLSDMCGPVTVVMSEDFGNDGKPDCKVCKATEEGALAAIYKTALLLAAMREEEKDSE